MKRIFSIFLALCMAISLFPCFNLSAKAVATVENVSGHISSDTTWTNDNFYIIEDNVVVDRGVILTIEPGVIVKALNSAIIVDGILNATGDSESGITLTSINDDIGGDTNKSETAPARGNWAGIIIKSGGTVTLSYTDIKYSGQYYSDRDFYGTCIDKRDGGNLTMSNCALSDCATKNAVNLIGNGGAIITDTSISGAETSGIYMYNSAASISGGNYTYNDEYGIYVDCSEDYVGTLPSIENASFGGNVMGAIFLQPQVAGTPVTNCDLTGQFIKIGAGTVRRAVMLNSDATYYLEENLCIASNFEISSGTVIKLKAKGNFTVEDVGTLATHGTIDDKVTLTSWKDNTCGEDIGDGTPASIGNWAGIIIKAGGTATLKHTNIKYSGQYYWDHGYIGKCIDKQDGGNLTMSNCTLSHCATKSAVNLAGDGTAVITGTSISGAVENGIYINTSNPTIYQCTITNNATGIYVEGTSNPTIGGSWYSKNVISSNAEYGVNNVSGEAISATHNNWGDLSGPYHPTLNPDGLGNKVSNDVNFEPFQTYSKPTLQSATTTSDGTKLILTFNKAMADPTGKHAQFTVSINESTNVVTAAKLNGTDNKKIELTLTETATCGQTVTVSYTAGTVASADNAMLDSFVSYPVINGVVSHGKIQFDCSHYSTYEGYDGWIGVERVDGSDGAVSVSYTTIDGTAVAGAHYVACSGTLTWADGEFGKKVIPYTTIQDNTYNGYLNMTYKLSNLTGGGAFTSDTLPVQIQDDDKPPAPTGLTATTGNRQVTLNWNSVKDAHYRVYCSEVSSSFTETDYVGNVFDGTSYTVANLTNGRKYYFAVTAGHNIKYSDFSQQAEATPQEPSSGGVPVPISNNFDVNTRDGSTTVSCELTETERGLKVDISSDSFRQLDKSEKPIVINTQDAMVVFDAPAVDYINGHAGTGGVSLTIEQADLSGFSKETQDMLANRPVYEFKLTADEKRLSDFGRGNAEISIPYVLQDGEDPNAVVVYYIDSFGEIAIVLGRYDAQSHTVRFTTEHFSAYAVGYNYISFSDVTENDWFYDAVTFCAARNITNGIGNNLLSPNTTLTRGQFVVMMMRAYGIDADENSSDNFDDAGNTYYTGYLSVAKKLGITNGIGDNLFAPKNKITRQDMFTLLYRALSILEKLPKAVGTSSLSDFSDVDDISDYAKEAMQTLVETGIISGSNGYLNPLGNSNRAQMAQVIYNLLNGN